ncbi:hypothetical protein KJ909_00420, partial [Patescibacteria group bacterium]|nr:hypothetical protein [Patescibacteria group bacterium]
MAKSKIIYLDKTTQRYRLWEMIPGFLAWMIIIFPLWGAFFLPKVVAYFVIAFLLYWLYQSFKSAILALIGYSKIKNAQKTDWKQLFNLDFRSSWLKYQAIHHVVIISSYKEPVSVIDMAVGSLAAQVDISLKKLHLVIGLEQRAGADSINQTTAFFSQKYQNVFGSLSFTHHPADTKGEIAGKHSNEAFAAKAFKDEFIKSSKNPHGQLDLKNLTLTSCDVDTIFSPKYFSALTYFFAKDRHRYLKFWQSPIFWHHNINQVPAPIRIIGTLGNIIHIANIQEPDGLFFNYSC